MNENAIDIIGKECIIYDINKGVNSMKEIIAYLHEFNYVTIAIRLVLAVLVGGIIGHERGKHGSAAGLRTHILVCIGSAMSSLTGYYVFHTLGIAGDVLRLSAQVVSGIGFLGAGMIIVKNSNVVTGLTTAAGMWATSAIGIALGFGFYSGAVIATVLCFFTAAFLSVFERQRKRTMHVYAEVDLSEKISDIIGVIQKEIDSEAIVEAVQPKSNVPNSVGLYITITKPKNSKSIGEKFDQIKGIRFSVTD